jgi:hypothetical protein
MNKCTSRQISQTENSPRASLIRHGTVARLRGRLTRGAGSITLERATAHDTLDFQFEVLTGRYRGLRFFEFMPLDISLDPRLHVWSLFCQPRVSVSSSMSETCGLSRTMARIKAMIDSALGLDPDDLSPSARPKRIFACVSDLDRIEFVGKVSVDKGRALQVNHLARVIVPGDPQWRRLMGSRAAERLPMAARG